MMQFVGEKIGAESSFIIISSVLLFTNTRNEDSRKPSKKKSTNQEVRILESEEITGTGTSCKEKLRKEIF